MPAVSTSSAAVAMALSPKQMPPPASAAAAGSRRRRARPQSILGLGPAHHDGSSTALTNRDATNSNNDSTSRLSSAHAPQRMFLRDAILEQMSRSAADHESAANADANANDDGSLSVSAGKQGQAAPTPGLYVRLMGRVVQISSLSGDGSSGGGGSFVMDDGTASVRVVMQQQPTEQLSGHLHPSAAKRPRLGPAPIATAVRVLPELELGDLVDCVGCLSVVLEVPQVTHEEGPKGETQEEDDAEVDVDDGSDNDRKIGSEESLERQGGDDTDATVAMEMNQNDIDGANACKPADEQQPSCSRPTNDDIDLRASPSAQGPQQPEQSDMTCRQQSRYCAVLSAVTIAPVSHPDAESLRTLELVLASSSSSHSAATTTSSSSSDDDDDDQADTIISGIHMAGDLTSKIGAFQRRPRAAKSDAPAVGDAYSICSNTAFRFIRSAAADGGITEEDLAIALGCKSGGSGASGNKNGIVRRRTSGGGGSGSRRSTGTRPGDGAEVTAVRQVLQELQAGGEIYKTRRGTYLPL